MIDRGPDVNNNHVLIIAPHPDDEILGVGGTIARFADAGAEVSVLTVAAHMPPLYDESVHKQTIDEARKAHAIVGVKASIFLDIPAVFVFEPARANPRTTTGHDQFHACARR